MTTDNDMISSIMRLRKREIGERAADAWGGNIALHCSAIVAAELLSIDMTKISDSHKCLIGKYLSF
jgi:hypothetical protein